MAAAATSLFIVVFFLLDLHSIEAQIGVCYGMLGNNLPCPQDTVNLYNSNNIGAMRLYGPNQDTIESVQGTDIKVMLGVPNEDIVSIACDQSTADEWVETNVVPYADSIKYIAVGNEVKPSDYQASSMVPAMQNIQNALISNYIDTQIKVSTAIDTNLTKNSYPPSKTTFENLSYITPIVNFLTNYDSPLLLNIQPYFAYISDTKNIKLDYALFTACDTVIIDNGMKYQNLFDAIYDSVYVALQKVVTTIRTTNHSHINGVNDEKTNTMPPSVVASESGWPSNGGFHRNDIDSKIQRLTSHHDIDQGKEQGCGRRPEGGEPATIENAKTYYTNLIKHVKQGSPMTQGQPIETYLFAMFDENQKQGDEIEHHFGLFTPDMRPKYGQLNFC